MCDFIPVHGTRFASAGFVRSVLFGLADTPRRGDAIGRDQTPDLLGLAFFGSVKI